MNEMKPEDVMRALANCLDGFCDECPYVDVHLPMCRGKLIEDTLALLREKDAEIGRLTKDFLDYQADVKMEIADARAEAITEFAERLKKEALAMIDDDDDDDTKEAILASVAWIDQTAKELKEAPHDP